MTDIESHSDVEQASFDALVNQCKLGEITREQLKSRLVELECEYADILIEEMEWELEEKEHLENMELMKRMESGDSEACIKVLEKIWGIDAST